MVTPNLPVPWIEEHVAMDLMEGPSNWNRALGYIVCYAYHEEYLAKLVSISDSYICQDPGSRRCSYGPNGD